MNKFFNTCRRCVNPWVLISGIAIIAGLLYFIPVVGIATLFAFLPLAGCVLMCGSMMFFMKKDHKDNK